MLAWTPSLEIGVEEIDAQHRSLFSLAERFATAVEAGDPPDRLEETFAFLVEYALEHFSAEERYMREIRYPRLTQHIQEHAHFKRQLAALVPQWNTEGGSRALLTAVQDFLESWLRNHVSKSDQRIAEYLRGDKL